MLGLKGFAIGRQHVRHADAHDGNRARSIESATPEPHPEHPVYPYLLKGLTIDRPNQVWATDLTYIPMARGFVYLVAIMDWATRRVLPTGCRSA